MAKWFLQVHAFFQTGPRCYGATCVCGAAIQSGPEIFIYDKCRARNHTEKSRPTRIGHLQCGVDEYMSIRQNGMNLYEVRINIVINLQTYFYAFMKMRFYSVF